MTPDLATEWIAYATRQPVASVQALGLDRDQLVTLAGWLAERPLINPRQSRPLKVAVFKCACCNQTFEAEYRTKRPKYCSTTCRQRAYRRRKRDRELAALEAQRMHPAALVRKPSGGGFRVVHEVTA